MKKIEHSMFFDFDLFLLSLHPSQGAVLIVPQIEKQSEPANDDTDIDHMFHGRGAFVVISTLKG